MPKLYDIPKGSTIKLKKGQKCSDGSTYITFDHIDGMYSYCVTENGGIIHLAASTALKKVKDYYILA
jgi:hypothetical protein